MENVELDSTVIKVKDFLINKKLNIPIYQRPYKWTKPNITQLIGDIKTFSGKPSYRFGTIVIHKNKDEDSYDIVDGQQRTITLILILKALYQVYASHGKEQHLLKELSFINENIAELRFKNPITQQNIYKNYQEIKRLVADFDEELISFLLNHCEFIIFKLEDVSEAFQFFDSQNSRGKDLDPHDLLKAFHLRSFEETDQENKFRIVNNWENTDTNELAELFGLYLYRIKGWTIGNSAREFTKNNIHLFKGVNINEQSSFPYSKGLRILHHYIDEYNNSFYSKVNQQQLDYPFQLNETIINGRRFFEMIQHYHAVFQNNIKNIDQENELSELSKKILYVIDTYDGKNRTGDGYSRLLFDTVLIYYVDRFGLVHVNTAIQFFFIWSYNLRLSYESVYLASMDNYVLNNNLFKHLNDSLTPKQVFDFELNVIKDSRSTKTKEIEDLFKDLNYL